MLNLGVLDVVIGLILVYVLLSLVCSAMREGLEGFLKSRAVTLERGIRELLHDPTGTGLASDFYAHPLICALFGGRYDAARLKTRGFVGLFGGWGSAPAGAAGAGGAAALRMPLLTNLPSYIPARNFAVAVIDLVARGPGSASSGATASPAISLESLRSAVGRLGNPAVQRAVLSAIDLAKGDLARVQTNLEAWYDSAMDRVSGWYKRRTQLILFVLGLAVTCAVNANTITIATYLMRHESAREAIVAAVPGVAGDQKRLDVLFSKLEGLNLPIGWPRAGDEPKERSGDQPKGLGWWWSSVFEPVFGLLATAFAISLGAPFWFDLLNKVMVIRSTVKPHEKSQEEGSEDRQDARVIVEAAPPRSSG